MTTRIEPIFDPLSFARRGPGQRTHLTPTQIAQIERTVGRTPEVMVKVLPKGTNSLQSVKNHIQYIGRRGRVELTSDDDEKLQGKGVAEKLIEDWDLELNSLRGKNELTASSKRSSPKLLHKVLFSMPPGTDPERVLGAVRVLCREEFGLKHRYVMALHTDEPHPHVHVLVKAMSEQGVRLHIRKETLRWWRLEFARHLRTLGVPANATPRSVRGEMRIHKPDGIFRASERGSSTHMRERATSVAREILAGTLQSERGKATLLRTQQENRRAWNAVADTLSDDRHNDLASKVRRFVGQMPPPRTEKELLADAVASKVRGAKTLDRSPTR